MKILLFLIVGILGSLAHGHGPAHLDTASGPSTLHFLSAHPWGVAILLLTVGLLAIGFRKFAIARS